MSTPKFAVTHNLVAFLEKPEESNGFEEIIDFLNASSVQYVLTKVIITETSIRSDLNLDDACGTDCLPTATIFEELARMGYEKPSSKLTFYKAFFSPQWKFFIHTITQCLSVKTTAWNEFSSTMASAIICLATNQKFNFSMFIFNAMVKQLEGWVKFLMYPRFVPVFINQQLGDMSHHKKTYVNPSHTKKIFANMKREEKDFSRRVTPLFATMTVQANQEEGADSATPTDSHSAPIITQPSSSKPQKKQSNRKQRKDSAPTKPTTKETTPEENVATPSCDPPKSGEDRIKLIELMNLCTQLQSRVLALETTKSNQSLEIKSLKRKVKSLENRRKSRTPGFKRLRKVGSASSVESSNDVSLGAQEDISKQGRKITNLDADAEVTLEKDVAEKEVSAADPVTTVDEVVTTANVEVTTVNALTTTIDELEIKAAKPKAVTSSATTTTTTKPKARGVAKDKGKGIMVEPKVPLNKKDQVSLDEEMARNLEARLQAKLIKEKRLARQKEKEANIALLESWDNT
ncbi:hypothetical protein Tco_0014887 [Tanacetum coccineum]